MKNNDFHFQDPQRHEFHVKIGEFHFYDPKYREFHVKNSELHSRDPECREFHVKYDKIHGRNPELRSKTNMTKIQITHEFNQDILPAIFLNLTEFHVPESLYLDLYILCHDISRFFRDLFFDNI